jgi:uncharacterized membrane protein YeaQ/YmgE (transglycosylase-associated protein family)
VVITFASLVVWFLVALLVGVCGELIARRRAPDGIIGAVVLGFLAIFLVVGLLHFSIAGEPNLAGVPLISSIIAAAILVFIWSAFVYHNVYRRRI